jgi:hypothetical protein
MVVELAVDAVERVELAQHGRVPLRKAEALAGESPHAREVGIADELQLLCTRSKSSGAIDCRRAT